MLASSVEGTGPRLALLHGFTQDRRCWGPVAADLATDHEVVRVDAPGHGGSSAVRADLAAGAELVVATVGRAAYLGYSMGGRLALHAALAAPEQVVALVLVGATGGLDDPGERAARVAQDEQLARRLEDEGLEAFLDHWLSLPLFAGLDPEAGGLDARLGNTVDGLASSLRLAGTGSQEPLWDRLDGLTMPVLVIAGERDPKFRALGERLVDCIGANASLAIVPGAGHAAHLERPDDFLGIVRPWLGRHHR
ncbi:MAG TPA: alpha/beta fold hydrolase [Acidimicrobiales bacterium]|nr:alpha/beta fold hydrolase [Acidimicrobiales bacterium]